MLKTKIKIATMKNPAARLLQFLPELDFAVLAHGWASHGRDYVLHIQDCLGADPGEHQICFTHCVRADCETRVRDDVWPRSWNDELTDYQTWLDSGRPDGYVWGTNWSNAYPGLDLLENSDLADEWTRKIGKPFFECTLETDRFYLRLVYHDVRSEKISDNTDTISSTIIPLGD